VACVCRLSRRASGHLATVLQCPVWRRRHADRRPEALTGRLCAAHVIAGLDPVDGGPAYSVPRFCAKRFCGCRCGLWCCSRSRGSERPTRCILQRLSRLRFAWDYARIPILRGLRSSQGLSSALRDAALTADVIHNHGLWLMPNVSAGGTAANGPTPLIISPRGMLAPAALAFRA